MNSYEKEVLERRESHLRQAGAEKCNGCGFWMGKEYLNKKRRCEECK
jgi:predicted Zn-ribbon and HTH transcriptional regulator